MQLIISSNLKLKYTKQTKHPSNFWNNLKMLKLKSKHWSSISSISSRELLFTSQWRMTRWTRSWLSSSTTILRGLNSRSCLWGRRKVYTSLVPRELRLKLRRIISRSELVEVTCLLMNSLISTHLLNLRSLKEKIHSRDSVRKWLFRRPLSMPEPEKFLQLELLQPKADLQEKQLSEIKKQFKNYNFEIYKTHFNFIWYHLFKKFWINKIYTILSYFRISLII